MSLYAATIALSAFLLFLIQPIIARQILPWFGGSAAVWTTCLVFFQVLLLVGYTYSDWISRRLPLKRQARVHAVLLVTSLAWLPIAVPEALKPVDASQPIGRILMMLAMTIGLPYLMLATTGPLIQAWFARRYRAAQVYRLYALSNIASMAALVGYPPLIEPNAGGHLQTLGWSIGYALFVGLAIATAWSGLRAQAGSTGFGPDAGSESPPVTAAPIPPPDEPDARMQALWLLLSALGSVLLLSITTHITQNIASIPFLWVLPLAIYLLTFILCFDGSGWYWRWVYPLLAAAFAVTLIIGLSFRYHGGAKRSGIRASRRRRAASTSASIEGDRPMTGDRPAGPDSLARDSGAAETSTVETSTVARVFRRAGAAAAAGAGEERSGPCMGRSRMARLVCVSRQC